MRSDVLGRPSASPPSSGAPISAASARTGRRRETRRWRSPSGSPGEPVVVSRSMHKSVLAGLVLSGLDPVWVRPDVDPATGLPLALPPERVALRSPEASGACGVFLVEPSFVGVLSDVAAMAEIAHGAGIPLVVDQAWGAHFGFHPACRRTRSRPAPTASSPRPTRRSPASRRAPTCSRAAGFLDLERLEEAFELLHTTSPSAALLASLDRARMIMATRGEELLGETLRLAALRPRAPRRGGGPRPRRLRRPDEARARPPGNGRGRARGGGRPLRPGHPLRARQPGPARPAPDDRRHGGRGGAALRRADRLARAPAGRAPPAGSRERRLGRHAGDGDDAAGGVLLRAGDGPRPRTPPAASRPRWWRRTRRESRRSRPARSSRGAGGRPSGGGRGRHAASDCADPALATLQVVARP